jgi:hypothetical protein
MPVGSPLVSSRTNLIASRSILSESEGPGFRFTVLTGNLGAGMNPLRPEARTMPVLLCRGTGPGKSTPWLAHTLSPRSAGQVLRNEIWAPIL